MRVECPQCRATALFAGGKAYCPRCGWNRAMVERQLRRTLKQWLWAAFIFLLFALAWSGWLLRRPGAVALIVGVPIVVFGLVYMALRRNLGKFLDQKAPASAPAAQPDFTAGVVTPQATPDSTNESYRVLLSLPRPRQVRLLGRAKSSTAIVVTAAAIFEAILIPHLYLAWLKAGSLRALSGRDWFLAGTALFFLLVLAALPRTLSRQRDLLANGEVALAQVIGQWRSRNTSSIRYKFSDASGRSFERLSSDYTQKLYEGMAVPVFYDRERPDRQIAQCGAFYEVILPGVDRTAVAEQA